jgi:hypothetical protein
MCKDLNNPQSVKSAITYARRTAISAIVSLPETDENDDDGNAASGKHKEDVKKTEVIQNQPQKIRDEMPISMTDASFLYSESQSKRKYNKSDVDAILIKRYGVDSATKLKKYQYDELMESLKK